MSNTEGLFSAPNGGEGCVGEYYKTDGLRWQVRLIHLL